ncbi:MAG: hypothetical protein Q9M31_00035 [Mariprofundus sp.]|nr:hypothetical protein [Mariprofundus sp.]
MRYFQEHTSSLNDHIQQFTDPNWAKSLPMTPIREEQAIHFIVTRLMDLLAIPDGNNLIPYFGDGHEASNREAMTTWVMHMAPDLQLDEVTSRLTTLHPRATKRLSSVHIEQRPATHY